MSIYFRNTPVSAPFMFESLGNHWNQDNISRPDGYPYYHYLQTEKGTGRIEVNGKHYTLGANEGILIAPSVPHSYHRNLLHGLPCLPHLPELSPAASHP